jgi:acid stress-induced BolA-like protein IbaG/YrbA
MKALLGVVFGVALGVATLAPWPVQAGQKGKVGGKGLEGDWQGTLNVETKLRLVVRFATKGGKLTGSMDVPDQKAEGLTMEKVAVKGTALRFEIEKIKGTYEGKLKPDGSEVVGRWKQGDYDLPLTFKRQAAGKKAGKGLDGVWQGTLVIENKVRLVVHFRKKGGKLTGTLDSPDQGKEGLEMDKITFKGDALRFEIKEIDGVFEGKLQAKGDTLQGRWKQGDFDLPLTFRRQPAAKGARAPRGAPGVTAALDAVIRHR